MIATTAAELLQMATRKPRVRKPPLSLFDMSLSCSAKKLTTSSGAIGRSARTTSSVKFWRGKKLARASRNRNAGNSARKK